MPIPVSQGSKTKFPPHPTGQFGARCIDVVDVGWQPGSTKYPEPKYKIRIVFFAGQSIEKDGTRYPAYVSQYVTATLHENGHLLPFLEHWRGKPFTRDELASFDVEKMIGATAFLQLVHDPTGQYTNIQTIARLPDGMTAPDAPTDYVRVCDRPGWTGPAPHPEMSDAPDPEYQGDSPNHPSNMPPDDGLPFAPLRLTEPLFG